MSQKMLDYNNYFLYVRGVINEILEILDEEIEEVKGQLEDEPPGHESNELNENDSQSQTDFTCEEEQTEDTRELRRIQLSNLGIVKSNIHKLKENLGKYYFESTDIDEDDKKVNEIITEVRKEVVKLSLCGVFLGRELKSIPKVDVDRRNEDALEFIKAIIEVKKEKRIRLKSLAKLQKKYNALEANRERPIEIYHQEQEDYHRAKELRKSLQMRLIHKDAILEKKIFDITLEANKGTRKLNGAYRKQNRLIQNCQKLIQTKMALIEKQKSRVKQLLTSGCSVWPGLWKFIKDLKFNNLNLMFEYIALSNERDAVLNHLDVNRKNPHYVQRGFEGLRFEEAYCDFVDEISEIEVEISENQVENSGSQVENSESQVEMSERLIEISGSQLEISISQAEISNSQAEISDIQNEISYSQNEISDIQIEIGDSQNEISNSQNEISNSQVEISENQVEISKNDVELSMMNDAESNENDFEFSENDAEILERSDGDIIQMEVKSIESFQLVKSIESFQLEDDNVERSGLFSKLGYDFEWQSLEPTEENLESTEENPSESCDFFEDIFVYRALSEEDIEEINEEEEENENLFEKESSVKFRPQDINVKQTLFTAHRTELTPIIEAELKETRILVAKKKKQLARLQKLRLFIDDRIEKYRASFFMRDYALRFTHNETERYWAEKQFKERQIVKAFAERRAWGRKLQEQRCRTKKMEEKLDHVKRKTRIVCTFVAWQEEKIAEKRYANKNQNLVGLRRARDEEIANKELMKHWWRNVLDKNTAEERRQTKRRQDLKEKTKKLCNIEAKTERLYSTLHLSEVRKVEVNKETAQILRDVDELKSDIEKCKVKHAEEMKRFRTIKQSYFRLSKEMVQSKNIMTAQCRKHKK